jgi:hypothetical protein
MVTLDRLDRMFIAWAFVFQLALIAHFAIRRLLFESYTVRYGWIVYGLSVPALVISVLLLRAGKHWTYWIGGLLLLLFSGYGFWIDYVQKIPFRSPFRADVGIPYVLLYLAPVMFYWWPLANLSRPLWFVFAILFAVATALNLTSH